VSTEVQEQQFIRTFPCTACGAKLSFAPGTHELKCGHCGTENTIAGADGAVEELDYEAQLRALEGSAETIEEEQVRCGSCGASQTLASGTFASHCAFCGAAITAQGYANRRIKPQSMVPFQLDASRAQEAFRGWIRRRWLAPLDLARYAQTDVALSGVYLPFWLYDCRTSSDYVGARGTRHDKTTSWERVSGHIDHFHDDVAVLASVTLAEPLRDSVWRWDTRALVAYRPEYVSGFRAEAYQIGLKDGFTEARRMIDDRIRNLIRREIGGDEQRIETVRTQYSEVGFKHALMPVWISAYRYRDRPFRFLVNGQTGEVVGESPVAWWKVALLVMAALVLLYFILKY
jgi:predicted RNA-binding Zn-ribbon protein involved in translation (DUF1610 family)